MYPHITWVGCSAHVLDLMMEDIASEMEWAATVIEEAKEVSQEVQFINANY